MAFPDAQRRTATRSLAGQGMAALTTAEGMRPGSARRRAADRRPGGSGRMKWDSGVSVEIGWNGWRSRRCGFTWQISGCRRTDPTPHYVEFTLERLQRESADRGRPGFAQLTEDAHRSGVRRHTKGVGPESLAKLVRSTSMPRLTSRRPPKRRSSPRWPIRPGGAILSALASGTEPPQRTWPAAADPRRRSPSTWRC